MALEIMPATGDALLVTDIQNDFLPGGALGVPEGDRVIPVINRHIRLFEQQDLPIILTRDWHPPGHVSFKERGGPWPVHCVQGSPGAEFAPGLLIPREAAIVSKASAPDEDAYSAFQGTNLADMLHSMGVRRIFVGGLATDYCVLNTVRDAIRAGFEVVLLPDACRAVDLQAGDGERALEEMRGLGARELESSP